MTSLPVRLASIALGLALAPVACSTPVEPGSVPTLLITNATCESGACAPVVILGFPSDQPHTPGGYWSVEIGVAAGPSACLSLPPSAMFRVIDASTGAADTLIWTIADPLALGVPGPGGSRILALPSTGTFVPADASGWRVTLPGGTGVARAQPCTP